MNTADLIQEAIRLSQREDRRGSVSPPIFMVQNTDQFRNAIRYANAEFQTSPDYEYAGGQRPLLDYSLKTEPSAKFSQLRATIRRIQAIGGVGPSRPDYDRIAQNDYEDEHYDVTPILGEHEDDFG